MAPGPLSNDPNADFAHADLGDAEQRMRSIVEHVVDGIISSDERGTITTFNPAAERLFGYGAAEAIGRNVRILMPEPYRSGHDGYLQNYLRTGQAKIMGVGREVVGRRKDGSTFPMELAISEFRRGASVISLASSATSPSASAWNTNYTPDWKSWRRPTGRRTSSLRCSVTSCATRWRRYAMPYTS